MRQVSYVSRALVSEYSTDILAILRSSLRNNTSRGLTGCLHMQDGWFFQILEGPPPAVSHMLATIRQDRRNADLRVLFDHFVPARVFSDWTMSLTSNHDIDLKDHLKVRDLPLGQLTADVMVPFFKKVAAIKAAKVAGFGAEVMVGDLRAGRRASG